MVTGLDAVLWDLDGTLIDSEPYWIDAEARMTAEFDVPWSTEDALSLVGTDLWDGAQVFIDRGVPLEADAIVERLTNEVLDRLREHVPYRPGARELLGELRQAGVRCALVTMSTRSVVDLIVPALTADLGISPFDATVAGDEVAEGKPSAVPYEQGLALLGASAAASIGIEDSFPGVTASLAAGLTTIAVPHAVDVSTIPGVIHWPTLSGRSVSDLRALKEVAR